MTLPATPGPAGRRDPGYSGFRDRLVARPIDASDDEHQAFVAVLRKLWRHRSLILAAILLATGGTALIALSLPQHYVADARIIVGIPQPRLYGGGGGEPSSSEAADAARVQSEAYVLQSRGLAKTVVDKLRLASDPDFNSALRPKHRLLGLLLPTNVLILIDRIFDNGKPAETPDHVERRMVDQLIHHTIAATPLGRSNVIDIEADTRNPQLSSAIANTLSNTYLDRERATEGHTTDRLQAYFDNRIEKLRQQVQHSEEAAEAYRRDNKLYQVGNQDLTAQTLGLLNQEIARGGPSGDSGDSLLGSTGGGSTDGASDLLSSPLITSLKTEQSQAARNLAQLRSTYGPAFPRVRDAEAELEAIDSKISSEEGNLAAGARRRHRAAREHYGALNRRLERTKAQMGLVNQKSVHLLALQRDAAINIKLLEDSMARAKDVLGQVAVREPDSKLISPAEPPLQPTYPPRMLLILIGTLVGALGGTMIALLRDGADLTFRHADQIELATGLPVMTLIPNYGSHLSPPAAVLRDPLSSYGDSLRRLYIMLAMSEATRTPKTVLFGSAVAGEGKSVTVVSLCRLLATAGKRVLLIDCDWRSPTVHKLLQRPINDGLRGILADPRLDPREVIQHDVHSGLEFITAGHWSPADSYLLHSPRLSEILSVLRDDYDLIVLDCPPVLVGAEVLPIAASVDKVVFLVRWGHTKRVAAMEAIKQLVEARADFAGVAFSRVDTRQYGQYAYTASRHPYGSTMFRRIGSA